jgi:AspT/YidE/YbjL antiporter-like protein
MSWLTATLRSYPEIAVFLSLGVGYWVGAKSFKGFSLGAVTATLLAAIAIGQLGITISPNVKSVFFLMFLFAVGYGVGPQFVRGIAKDGLPQAIFSVILCVLCLAAPYIAAKVAGYDVGSAAGLFAGSQTISASMGLATDAINRLGLPPDQAKPLLDAMPTAYAVTYIYGTIGSALILAMLGPKLLGIDLVKACKEYEEKMGGAAASGGGALAWHEFTLRAYRVEAGGRVAGLTVGQAEALEPAGVRLFIERIRKPRSTMPCKPAMSSPWRAGASSSSIFSAASRTKWMIRNCSRCRWKVSISTSRAKKSKARRSPNSRNCRARVVCSSARSSAARPKRPFPCCPRPNCIAAIRSRSSAARRTRLRWRSKSA